MKAFGTYRIPAKKTQELVSQAISCGISHIDTAQLYRNELETISAVKHHSHVTLTTKIHFDKIRNSDRDNRAIETSLDPLCELDPDSVTVLLHAPVDNYTIAWKQLERTHHHIGVSNFDSDEILALSSIPVVNQIEVTPFNPCPETVKFCLSHGITIESHSSLTKGKQLTHPQLIHYANTYRVTPAQVLMGWGLSRGFTTIFSSQKTTHIHELTTNWDTSVCFGFSTETRFKTHRYIVP